MNMIAIILAGGLGTRISNETTKKPKQITHPPYFI